MKYIFLIQISLALVLISGCGLLGSGEPEPQEESTQPSTSEPSAAEETDSGEQTEALKDELHKQEIEAQEQKIEELIAAKKQEVAPPEEAAEEQTPEEQTAEEQSIEVVVPELPADTTPDLEEEPLPSTGDEDASGNEPELSLMESPEEDLSETLEQPDTVDPAEPEVVVESVPVDESEEGPPEKLQALITKTQPFFAEEESEAQQTESDLPVQQEALEPPILEPEVTVAMLDTDSPDEESVTPEPDICAQASELIESMRQYLEEIEAIPDRRLRDPQNDVLFPTIYFDFDQSLIKVNYNEMLQSQTPCVLAELEKNDDLVVQIEGHADERGNDEYNLALGHRRANAVHSLVKVYVASPSTLRTISYGEEIPAIDESNREAWAKNRRVVFTLLLKSQ